MSLLKKHGQETMTPPQLRRVEVLLAGAFLAICVQPTLSDLAEESAQAPNLKASVIVTQPGPVTAAKELSRAAVTASGRAQAAIVIPPVLDDASWGAKVNQLSSFEDLLTLPVGVQERELIGRMLADEFDQGKPFQTLVSLLPMAQILRRGVSHVERSVFRSPAFLKTFGYDMVRYTIDHPDQSQSVILAYRERTARGQASIGEPDTRPVFSLFAVALESEMSEVTILRDGQLNQHATLPRAEALAAASRPTLEATPLLSSR